MALLDVEVECGFAMPIGWPTIGAAWARNSAGAADHSLTFQVPIGTVVLSRVRARKTGRGTLGERRRRNPASGD
jgi:hypothetical protein